MRKKFVLPYCLVAMIAVSPFTVAPIAHAESAEQTLNSAVVAGQTRQAGAYGDGRAGSVELNSTTVLPVPPLTFTQTMALSQGQFGPLSYGTQGYGAQGYGAQAQPAANGWTSGTFAPQAINARNSTPDAYADLLFVPTPADESIVLPTAASALAFAPLSEPTSTPLVLREATPPRETTPDVKGKAASSQTVASIQRARAALNSPDFQREVSTAVVVPQSKTLQAEMNRAMVWYQGRAKSTMRVALEREARMQDDLDQIFEEADLPTWLTGIAVVEAGFNPSAVAPSKHSGLWQFSAESARHFGLTVNSKVDQRLDAEASTRAAARMLKFLHKRYGDWPLAMAAFNVGHGRVDRALAVKPNASLGALVDAGLVPRQTLTNVARYLAAASILESPASYGFAKPDSELEAINLTNLR